MRTIENVYSQVVFRLDKDTGMIIAVHVPSPSAIVFTFILHIYRLLFAVKEGSHFWLLICHERWIAFQALLINMYFFIIFDEKMC